jgi:hypothetical protein
VIVSAGEAAAPVWCEAVMWVALSAAEREEFLAGCVLAG